MKDIYFWVAARFSLGLIFLWAFFDKVFGLGFATPHGKAWLIAGNSPTRGFLASAVHGPLKGLFNNLAGVSVVDWLFMLGLLGIGLALVLGIGMKIAGWSGALLMLLMWLALLPPTNHPFIDEHIVYGILLIGLATSTAKPGRHCGLGKWWSQTKLVQTYSFFE